MLIMPLVPRDRGLNYALRIQRSQQKMGSQGNNNYSYTDAQRHVINYDKTYVVITRIRC